jgi:hypothetical protein
LAAALETSAMIPVAMLGPVRIQWQLFNENGETQFSLWKKPTQGQNILIGPDEFHSALGIYFRIANIRTRWRCNFKNTHRMGTSLFNDNLSNEPTFSQIHLAEQYLLNL